VDNLRNFLLTPTKEMLSFFQQLREVLWSGTLIDDRANGVLRAATLD
jgi:hypothetical protein